MATPYKLHSLSPADKGTMIASCLYASDAAALILAFPGRQVGVKFAGRVIWRADRKEDKDAIQTPGFRSADLIALLTVRVRDMHRQAYDDQYGAGAYEALLAKHDHEQNLARLAKEVRSTATPSTGA